jgi:hypothetical protein
MLAYSYSLTVRSLTHPAPTADWRSNGQMVGVSVSHLVVIKRRIWSSGHSEVHNWAEEAAVSGRKRTTI